MIHRAPPQVDIARLEPFHSAFPALEKCADSLAERRIASGGTSHLRRLELSAAAGQHRLAPPAQFLLYPFGVRLQQPQEYLFPNRDMLRALQCGPSAARRFGVRLLIRHPFILLSAWPTWIVALGAAP